MPERPDYSFLDSIIEEIWQGKRIVVAPPGTLAFVATNIAFTLGGALFCAAIVPELLRVSISDRAQIQLVGIALVVPQVVVPALMVARGRREARRLFARGLEVWIVLVALSTLYLYGSGVGLRAAGVVSAALLAFARYCVATPSYLVFAVFQERMRLRRMRR